MLANVGASQSRPPSLMTQSSHGNRRSSFSMANLRRASISDKRETCPSLERQLRHDLAGCAWQHRCRLVPRVSNRRRSRVVPTRARGARESKRAGVPSLDSFHKFIGHEADVSAGLMFILDRISVHSGPPVLRQLLLKEGSLKDRLVL